MMSRLNRVLEGLRATLIERTRERDAARQALENINRRLSPGPSRVFDELIRDTDWAVAEARRVLAQPGETE
jgi:hypothetical protein